MITFNYLVKKINYLVIIASFDACN
jgi:hypothetical protein